MNPFCGYLDNYSIKHKFLRLKTNKVTEHARNQLFAACDVKSPSRQC